MRYNYFLQLIIITLCSECTRKQEKFKLAYNRQSLKL